MTISKSKGVYDTLIDETVCQLIKESGLASREVALDLERLPLVLSNYLRAAFHAKLAGTPGHKREEVARTLSKEVIRLLDLDTFSDVKFPAQLLKSLGTYSPNGSQDHYEQPLIPLSESALITNSSSEPSVGAEITRELASSDRVDILMAFIRFSGIRPHLKAFESVIERGGEVRVATTTYS